MNITYNNVSSPSNMVTFTEIPNILTISENIAGTKATITLQFDDGLQETVSSDSQYHITLFGETISNVLYASNAKNRRFYIADNGESTCMSVARALRNCSSIAADYVIVANPIDSAVTIVAKVIGSRLVGDYIETNIPNDYMSVSASNGTAYSSLFNSKIEVDIYNGSSANSDTYITTLEKNWYGNQCAFDVSPVLSTFSEYGESRPYLFVLNSIGSDGNWSSLGNVSGNTVIGYHANQSDKFKYAQGVQLLTNNSIKLYTYYNTIPYTVLCGSDTNMFNVFVSVKDSANNEIYNSNHGVYRQFDNYVMDGSETVPQSAFTSGYYVDITIGLYTTRYEIIKPLKASEGGQRVLWRNEYGGISFFDFTGSRSDSDTVDIETYEKNIFDYHKVSAFERKKIYANNYDKTVTLNSHLIDEDGKLIFNSLMRSKKIWTIINDVTYYIIPKSIEITEDGTYNGIYSVKLLYTYSDI